MKHWWLALSQQEKQTISLGSIIAVIFIIYVWVWTPLDNKISTMRTQVEQNQKLLAWMQSVDTQLANSKKPTQKVSSIRSTASLLSLTQSQIKQSTFANQHYQLRQADSDSVQLSLKQVDFDKLITWLNDSWREQGLAVAQLTVAPSESPGIVSAELQLTSS